MLITQPTFPIFILKVTDARSLYILILHDLLNTSLQLVHGQTESIAHSLMHKYQNRLFCHKHIHQCKDVHHDAERNLRNIKNSEMTTLWCLPRPLLKKPCFEVVYLNWGHALILIDKLQYPYANEEENVKTTDDIVNFFAHRTVSWDFLRQKFRIWNNF